ncbi:hypothetical protein SUGI_0352480, partial [Cryptomeria japonica]
AMEEEGYQNSGNEPLHVLMFPWLAHGLISAYAELSIRFAQQGIKVSLFSTPLNIAKIKPLFASRQIPSTQLLELPLPKVTGLPPEIENVSDLPMHLTPLFTTTFDGLEAPFEKLWRRFGRTAEEIAEVALGLEASYQPYLWALDGHSFWLPEGFVERVDGHSFWLPEGFVERVGEGGVVVRGWVPQREILAHLGIWGFMSHCGWNSMMEGMSNGLFFITSPMQFDQCYNARLVVEELKIGVEVGRRKDGAFLREEICKAVRMIIGNEGKEMRVK